MFRRVLPLVAALSAFPLVGFAQPLPDRAPIKGVIVDEAGRPVAAAVLTVRRQDDTIPTAFWGAEGRADTNGRFLIPEAEEGHYFVNVEAPGFAPLSNFALDWSTKSAPARLQLFRLTQFTLRIVSPDGTPLSQAPVWIRLRNENGQTPTRTVTNSKGEIVILNVAPSTYSLIVVTQNGIAIQRALSVGTSQSTSAETRLSQGATLRVRATDANGTPLGGASLVVFAQSPEEANRLAGEGADSGENWALVAAANAPQGVVSHDGDGILELKHIPAGRFSARLSVPGYGTKTWEFTSEDGAIVEWKADFPVRNSATLSLQVRDAQGQAVANAQVALRLLPLAQNGTFDEGENPFQLPNPNDPPDLPFPSSGSGARVAMTDASGKISLFPVRAGRFRIFASRPTSDSWLRAPVAPEGAPSDVVVSLAGPNSGEVQVP
ncbi:hypothetical protein IAD21_06191 [Abditibacteriota bacterium]|nr:hypothetical protein IAD21_06191 [Abditibacteriota bacterium]